jgi:hypothetical protein
MKKLVLAAPLLAALTAFGQASGVRNRVYDPATETTVRGEVEKVTEPARGRMSGTHLFVKADGAVFEVALGPAAFVRGKGFAFAAGDTVEVTGSKVTVSGKQYIVAREITKEGKTLTLRDKSGVPSWAGQRRGAKGFK